MREKLPPFPSRETQEIPKARKTEPLRESTESHITSHLWNGWMGIANLAEEFHHESRQSEDDREYGRGLTLFALVRDPEQGINGVEHFLGTISSLSNNEKGKVNYLKDQERKAQEIIAELKKITERYNVSEREGGRSYFVIPKNEDAAIDSLIMALDIICAEVKNYLFTKTPHI